VAAVPALSSFAALAFVVTALGAKDRDLSHGG